MNFELYDSIGLPKYTPQELANLIGLIATIDVELARQHLKGHIVTDDTEVADHYFTD